jgi:alanine dehydrogenase
VLALSRSDLRELVPMGDAVDLMKIAFRELSAKRARAPLRSVLEVNDEPSIMLMMPGYVPSEEALGFKVVSFFSGNPEHDLPAIHAMVCLIDPGTGMPLGVLEGAYVTALRTGAVSGAATDLLAREESSVVAIIGPGVQGTTQAAAVCAVRPIDRIIAVGRSVDRLNRYRSTLEQYWPTLAPMLETTTDPAAIREADVICTATTAKSPVFYDRDVKPGTHINAIGAFTPEMQEVPPETVARATVVVDDVSAALAEAGDLIKPLKSGLIDENHFTRELGQVVDGTALGRSGEQEITLFKSVGNAVQDVVVARFAIDRAKARGLGVNLELLD